jgi:hypothetical protein
MPTEPLIVYADPWAPAPWEVEVELREARRLLHAVDPAFALDPVAPFDLAREVAAVRRAALPLARKGRPWAGNEWLTFLHCEPASDDYFDVAQWMELMALMDEDAALPATDDLDAQAYALSTLISHAIQPDQMFEALWAAKAYTETHRRWSAAEGAPIPPAEGRKALAARNVLTVMLRHLEDYYAGPDDERWSRWKNPG